MVIFLDENHLVYKYKYSLGTAIGLKRFSILITWFSISHILQYFP